MQLFFQWYITFLIDISLIYQWYITDILNYINLKTFKWYIIDISSKNCDISSRQHLNDISSNRYINDISTYFYKDISARYMISQICMIYLFIIFYHWYISWSEHRWYICWYTMIYRNSLLIYRDISVIYHKIKLIWSTWVFFCVVPHSCSNFQSSIEMRISKPSSGDVLGYIPGKFLGPDSWGCIWAVQK